MSKYHAYFTDMHSNIHHEQIKELPKWIEQIKATMDFWPIAYYPFGMQKSDYGIAIEDHFPLEDIQKDWEYLREWCDKTNADGFTMFMGYEWQGSGEDGDHNVFFFDNLQDPAFPIRYKELVENYKNVKAIGIPHHLAYQLGYRGKNWDTHDETFSPFAETYSSHGSSENDDNPIGMDRHVHMGPRTGQTCVEQGWNKGYKFGVIASGDNHSCPGVYGFGYCAVLAKSNSKEDIWDAFTNRRTYGVSKERMVIDYTVDNTIMGGVVKPNKLAKLEFDVVGAKAIDRIEIIKDNVVETMIPHTSTWEKKPLNKTVRFKFQLELGWGPDRRIFPDIESRHWVGSIHTDGKLLSIEKCWSTFGQSLDQKDDQNADFEITSYKTTATGKWMGPSAITTEGFIFEIEDDIDHDVVLTIDGIEYKLAIKDLLDNSRIIPLMDEVKELVKSRFGLEDYYRKDTWWHNCYKIKIGKATPYEGYHAHVSTTVDTTDCHQIRIRAYQKNGGMVWTSPIFVEE